MLTTEAFNALLKTLEEPPKHVYFIFATTELHKIPITILSRCQRYELQRVGSEELAAHFSRLAQAESVALEKGAMSLIVREAEGSVRDGLSLLDQVLSYGDSPISTTDVVEVLGLVDRHVLLSITKALLCGNRTAALENLAETFRFGMDIKRFLSDLLDCFRTLLLISIEGCEKLLDLPADEISSFQAIAREHSVQTIHLKLNLLMRAAEDIRYSFQPRLTLETSFLSIIESGNVIGVETLLKKLDSAIVSLPPEPSSETVDLPTSSGPVTAPDRYAETDSAELNTEKKTAAIDAPDIKQTEEQPPPPPEPAPGPPSSEESLPSVPAPADVLPSDNEYAESDNPDPPRQRTIRKDWIEFVSYVKQRKEWMAQNLQQASNVKEEGQELFLKFDDPTECSLLRSKENRRVLTEYVLDFFQKNYTIHVVNPDDSDDPKQNNANGPKKRRQQLAANPLVRMTEEIFNGQAGNIRIGPLSR